MKRKEFILFLLACLNSTFDIFLTNWFILFRQRLSCSVVIVGTERFTSTIWACLQKKKGRGESWVADELIMMGSGCQSDFNLSSIWQPDTGTVVNGVDNAVSRRGESLCADIPVSVFNPGFLSFPETLIKIQLLFLIYQTVDSWSFSNFLTIAQCAQSQPRTKLGSCFHLSNNGGCRESLCLINALNMLLTCRFSSPKHCSFFSPTLF